MSGGAWLCLRAEDPLSWQAFLAVTTAAPLSIGALLSDFEEQNEGADDDDSAGADLSRLKDGITVIAGTLKKKALMRQMVMQQLRQLRP